MPLNQKAPSPRNQNFLDHPDAEHKNVCPVAGGGTFVKEGKSKFSS